MSKVIVGLAQASFNDNAECNIAKAIALVRQAAKEGAQIILLPELFASPYFCKKEEDLYFGFAQNFHHNKMIEDFQRLAKELKVVLPISFFEKDEQHYYNSITIINADGEVLGLYRKSHIPDGPGYEEKYYFRPGNTGFRTWKTLYGTIGVGICWDQWFPEAARAMALMGADLLFYPTAIGSEPENPALDTRGPWQRVMIGHAVANATPVIAANRIGCEDGQTFYGSSFIANHRGDKVAKFSDKEEGVLTAEFDLDAIAKYRASFGFFRDRRPELYGVLVTQ